NNLEARAAVVIFSSELGNFFAAAKTEPVVPGFAQAVARREISLVELVALEDLGEDSCHRKIVRVQNRVSGSDGCGMMRIASGDHGQISDLRVLERVTVIAAQCGCSIENFNRVNRKRFQDRETNPGAEKIVG